MANNRLICERAVYDWSFNDPRTLVYFCQQRLRGELLDKAAAERRRRDWPRTVLASVGNIASAFNALFARRAVEVPSMSRPALGEGRVRIRPPARLAQAA